MLCLVPGWVTPMYEREEYGLWATGYEATGKVALKCLHMHMFELAERREETASS